MNCDVWLTPQRPLLPAGSGHRSDHHGCPLCARRRHSRSTASRARLIHSGTPMIRSDQEVEILRKTKAASRNRCSLRNSSLSNSPRSRMALPSFKFKCAACPKTPNSSAASLGTCGDQFALRLYHRDHVTGADMRTPHPIEAQSRVPGPTALDLDDEVRRSSSFRAALGGGRQDGVGG